MVHGWRKRKIYRISYGTHNKEINKKNIVLMTTKIDAGAWNAHKCEPTELDGARNSMSHRMIDFDLT